MCDGKINDFSLLTFLLKNNMRKIPGKKVEVKTLILSNFKARLS
jgi:hypothetical protein